MKARVIFTQTDYSPLHTYKEGQIGIVDGYIRGGDEKPYAVCIIEGKFHLVPLYAIKFIAYEK